MLAAERDWAVREAGGSDETAHNAAVAHLRAHSGIENKEATPEGMASDAVLLDLLQASDVASAAM